MFCLSIHSEYSAICVCVCEGMGERIRVLVLGIKFSSLYIYP